MKEIIIDAFKAGDYPQGKFTVKELSEIAATYNPDNYEAPILIGHLSDPAYAGKSSIPAFGWIGKVLQVKDHLKLVVSQFSDELKEYIQKGFYKKVSAAFFSPTDPSNPTPGKWHFHHLAFLGASPPQVKGLEGIAFCEMSLPGIEFAEADLVLEGIEFDSIDDVEKAGTEDTLKDFAESCANFLKKAEAALTEDIDEDTAKQRLSLAIGDLNSELNYTREMHFTFIDKLENVEEHQENETVQMLDNKIGLLKKWTQKLIHKHNRKESIDMEDKEKKEFTDRITAQQTEIETQKTQLAEFAEKQRLADDAKRIADEKAADDALRATIKQFCTENKLNTKKHQDLHLEDILFAAGKANQEIAFADAKKPLLLVLQDAIKAFQLPAPAEGNMDKEFHGDETGGVPVTYMARIDAYIKEHQTEFAGLDTEQARSKAITLETNNKIILSTTNSKE